MSLRKLLRSSRAADLARLCFAAGRMDSAAFKVWLGQLFEDGPFKVALSPNAVTALSAGSAGYDKDLLDASRDLGPRCQLRFEKHLRKCRRESESPVRCGRREIS